MSSLGIIVEKWRWGMGKKISVSLIDEGYTYLNTDVLCSNCCGRNLYV